MIQWIAPFRDGWYPRVSPNGQRLLCGNATARVIEIASKKAINISPLRFISIGWLNNDQIIVAGDLGDSYGWSTYRFDAPDFQAPTRIGPGLNFMGCGGDVFAGGNTQQIWMGDSNGHARKLYPVGTEPVPGYAATVDTLGFIAGSVEVHTAPKIKVWGRSGNLIRTILPAYPANRFLIGCGGYVGYGYYGPSWMNTPDNVNVEVGVTPERAESPALAFPHKGEVWLATTNDRGIYLRPFGTRDLAIMIPTPAIDCSVVSMGDYFVIASQDDKGQMVLTEIDAATRLVPVPAPTPIPPPVIPPPKATIKTYTPKDGVIPYVCLAVWEKHETSGPIKEVHWMLDGKDVAVNDPSDPDHHYRIDTPGMHRLDLRVVGPGGEDKTGILRTVTGRLS